MNNHCVYIHISPSGKKYIGRTKQKPEYRWNNGKGYIHNQHFTRAIEKYGWDNFQHIIIAKGLTEDEAKWLEIELIRVNESANPNKGYNNSLGGEGTYGYHHTEEVKQKMSEAKKGTHLSKETKRKISESAKGKVFSKETRKKLSEVRKGENNPMYGKHLSEETKKKISESLVGNNHPRSKTVICITTRKVFFTVAEASKFYNVPKANIVKCCKNERKSAGKYNGQKLVWKYVNHKHNKTYRIAK